MSLFQCSACRQILDLKDSKSFPLCKICLNSLVFAPPLCKTCGSPRCTEQCLHPWRFCAEIESYSARYLLLGDCYDVLRMWKKGSGVLFDRLIFRPDETLKTCWKDFHPDAIIPVPQRLSRAWKMRGSRSEKIALWLQSQIHVPIHDILESSWVPPWVPALSTKRQGELKMTDRLQNKISFSVKNVKDIKRAILVDDFMTTGKTIRKTAEALKRGGVDHLHVFCLGVRLLRLYT